MRILLIIWLVVSGLELAITYAIAGVVAVVFIMTIPLAVPAHRREPVEAREGARRDRNVPTCQYWTSGAGVVLRGCDMRDMSRGHWELRMLGDFELSNQEGQIGLTPTEERLIAFLALEGRAITRESVAGCLWLTKGQPKAAASLRTTLWRIRSVARGVIRATQDRLALTSDLATDIGRARALALETITASTPPDPNRVALLSRDLLPDWYDDWVTVERERFRQTRLHALEAAAHNLSRDGRHAEAIDAAALAIEGEPLRESAHRTMIEMHIAEGNWVEALRTYERFRRLLFDELGIAPTADLAARFADGRIRDGDSAVTGR